MKTKKNIFSKILITLLALQVGKIAAQSSCNANFSVNTNSNIPATAMVNQVYNNDADGLYIWSWGDGTPNDTTYNSNWNYPSIAHNYTSTGTFTICLNYQSVLGGCNSSFCWAFPVSSTTLPPKSIAITSANDSTWFFSCPQLPATVSYYMNASVLGYLPTDTINAKISFGDGLDTTFKIGFNYGQSGPATSYSYFNHTYTTPGLFSVQYSLLDNAGTTGDTLTNYNEIDLQDSCGNLNGHAYVDMNSNCQFDNGDSVIANMWISVMSSTNSTYWAWTDSMGYYSIAVPVANSYTLAIPYVNFYGYTYVCGGSGLSGISVPSTVDIGLICPPGFDLSGDFWGWHFIPGSPAWVYADIYNFSCLPQSGTATLTLDPNTAFVSEVSGKPVTVSGNQVSWNFTNLSTVNSWWYWNWPEYRSINVNCSSNLTIGDSVCYTLSVSPVSGDINPVNNTITKCFPVKSSWDPNFKEVYPRGVGAQGYVAQNTEFTYTIHFQNTGTASAHNIAVLDTMDVDLDLNTFQVIASSHYVEPHIVGINLLKFEFNNIMLADSTTDPVASQGWVTYKIKAKPGQPGGTQYTNTAYIYFDFNPAVVTNTTLNTVELSAVRINENKNYFSGISLAPNPVGDLTQLSLFSKEVSKITVQVVDMLGQVMSAEEKVVNKGKNIFLIETKQLQSGIYLMNVINESGNSNSLKIIK